MEQIFNSAFVETTVQVAAVLVVIYVLLAVLVTQISSLIVSLLNLRGKQLKEAILSMVSDRVIRAKLIAHPMIQLVDASVPPNRHLSSEQADDIFNLPPRQVSYISVDILVEAMISILATDSSETFDPLRDAIASLPNNDQKIFLREMLRDLQSFGDTDTKKLRAAILELPDETHKQILSYLLESIEDTLGDFSSKSGEVLPLLVGFRKIEDPLFRNLVGTILLSARSLADVRYRFQMWFNYALERTSDIYKQKLQYIILVLSFLLALILNVDSLYIISFLWDNPKLSQSIAVVAQNLASTENKIQPEATQAAPVPEATPAPSNTSPVQSAETFENLLQLQLPIGWQYIPVTNDLIASSQQVGLRNPLYNERNSWNLLPGNNPNWLNLLIQKLLGLMITVIVVAELTPLLFDYLRRSSSSKGDSSPPPPGPTINVSVSSRD